MTESSGSENVLLMIGEVRGQLRELVHTIANVAQQVQAVNSKLDATAGTHSIVESLSAASIGHEARITALELIEARRAGAMGLGTWIFKVAPWIFGGGAMGAAFALAGKLVH